MEFLMVLRARDARVYARWIGGLCLVVRENAYVESVETS